jgi:IS605 OrfB family transposase
MKNKPTFTYHTRVKLQLEEDALLQQCAQLMNRVEHTLFAEVARGKTAASCKNAFLKQFNITARHFNACRVNLEGKIEACRAGQELSIHNRKEQIAALDKKIHLLENKPSKRFILHQKKRRRTALQRRLDRLEEDYKQKRSRLCFGSKKLFNAQYQLEKNGFASHLEWKSAWEASRNNEFFVLGSKDESAGNQTCCISLQSDGKFSLRLRLPKSLEEKGKYLTIPNVIFSYGHTNILAALNKGQAISYRSKKDATSWTIFASTAHESVETISQENIGAIGVDLNTDHIAIVETDRFGNPIKTEVLSWNSHSKTKGQLKAITGDICKKITHLAKTTKKPLVIENLDFRRKKLSLKNEGNKKFSRLLSHFAYGLFFGNLLARAFKDGVAIHRVNPAFTSVMGRVNYAKRYGLSIHLASALCIARRYQNFSEAPSSLQRVIPDGKGSHVAFVLPARNRMKHVWHFWSQVKKKLKTVLTAHFQAMNRSSSPVKPTPATANSS